MRASVHRWTKIRNCESSETSCLESLGNDGLVLDDGGRAKCERTPLCMAHTRTQHTHARSQAATTQAVVWRERKTGWKLMKTNTRISKTDVASFRSVCALHTLTFQLCEIKFIQYFWVFRIHCLSLSHDLPKWLFFFTWLYQKVLSVWASTNKRRQNSVWIRTDKALMSLSFETFVPQHEPKQSTLSP